MKRPKHWTEDHVDYYRERVAIMMEGNEYRLEGPAPLDLLQMAFEDTELFFKEIWRDMAKHDKHGVRKRESENMKFDLFNDGIEEEEIKKPETLREAPEHETETEIETEKQTDQTKTEAPIEPQAPDSVESIKQAVARPTRPDTPQATLFDMAPD
jgi:FtsZ-interacting cell division protein ZipA